MHVKASLGLYLKNAPPKHLGIRGESWTIGNKPIPLEQLIHELAISVVDFARNSGMIDVSQAQDVLEASAKNTLRSKAIMDVKLAELRVEAERKYEEGAL